MTPLSRLIEWAWRKGEHLSELTEAMCSGLRPCLTEAECDTEFSDMAAFLHCKCLAVEQCYGFVHQGTAVVYAPNHSRYTRLFSPTTNSLSLMGICLSLDLLHAGKLRVFDASKCWNFTSQLYNACGPFNSLFINLWSKFFIERISPL